MDEAYGVSFCMFLFEQSFNLLISYRVQYYLILDSDRPRVYSVDDNDDDDNDDDNDRDTDHDGDDIESQMYGKPNLLILDIHN